MIYTGDALTFLNHIPARSIDTCVTSPPYWGLRDYGIPNQFGLEDTPEQYIEHMVNTFRLVRDTLKDDGTLWLNLGDSYIGGGNNRGNTRPLSDKQGSNKGSGVGDTMFKKPQGALKNKDLVGMPWRVALALQSDGWYLRQDIIWSKPNAFPESVKDRCTRSHEYIFLLSKKRSYYFDSAAIRERVAQSTINDSRDNREGLRRDRGYLGKASNGGTRLGGGGWRNKRSVWSVTTRSDKSIHTAVFPEALITPCILAGSRIGGMVLDPFCGSGTTGIVAMKHERKFTGIELNPAYASVAKRKTFSLFSKRLWENRLVA